MAGPVFRQQQRNRSLLEIAGYRAWRVLKWSVFNLCCSVLVTSDLDEIIHDTLITSIDYGKQNVFSKYIK